MQGLGAMRQAAIHRQDDPRNTAASDLRFSLSKKLTMRWVVARPKSAPQRIWDGDLERHFFAGKRLELDRRFR